MDYLNDIKRPSKEEQITAIGSYNALVATLNSIKSDNPEIEIDPEIKIQISQRLIEMKCPLTIQDMLAGRGEQQTNHLEFTLGEALPLGLRLVNSED